MGINLTTFPTGFGFADLGEGFIDIVAGVAEKSALVRGVGYSVEGMGEDRGEEAGWMA